MVTMASDEREQVSWARPDAPQSMAGTGAANIAVELRRRIVDGDYAYGERLLSERNLAEHFGAARSTIRDALRRLEKADLVSRRMGSGTYVSHRTDSDSDDIAAATSPLELIDVRAAVEPQLIRLAVANASAHDLSRLDAALADVNGASDAVSFSRADESFHSRLAECTQNPLMVWLYGHLNEIRGHAQWHGMRDKILTKTRIQEYNSQHSALVAAIRSRDAETAASIIAEHLEKARQDLMGVNLDL